MSTKKPNYILRIGIILSIAFVVYLCNDLPTESYTVDNNIAAYSEAKRVVGLRLKAPSTATFSTYNQNLVKVDGNIYTVTGSVDSQNSFGAMLRSYYQVILSLNGDVWTVQSVKIED